MKEQDNKALEILKNFAPAKKIIKTIILSSLTRFALKIAIKKDKFLISFFKNVSVKL
jgi:hypothetical protein